MLKLHILFSHKRGYDVSSGAKYSEQIVQTLGSKEKDAASSVTCFATIEMGSFVGSSSLNIGFILTAFSCWFYNNIKLSSSR
jgi:hypothetical protein